MNTMTVILLQRYWFRISVETLAIMSQVLPGFPQFLQTNAGIVPEVGHGQFQIRY
jgi:hypothetical protein